MSFPNPIDSQTKATIASLLVRICSSRNLLFGRGSQPKNRTRDTLVFRLLDGAWELRQDVIRFENFKGENSRNRHPHFLSKNEGSNSHSR